MPASRSTWILLLLSGASACQKVPPNGAGETGGQETSVLATSGSTSMPTSGAPTGTTTIGATDDTNGSEVSSAAETTLPSQDMGVSWECLPWHDDCPEGQKCAVSPPTATCVPLQEDAGGQGEACVGLPALDSDTCAKGLFCNFATCDTYCKGPAQEYPPPPSDELVCPPGSVCVEDPYFIVVCIVLCDPLAPQCKDGQICEFFGQYFTCNTDQGEASLPAFSPCAGGQACAPGMLCAPSEYAVECSEPGDCCVPLCDLDSPTCEGEAQLCEPLPYMPPELAHVGICRHQP